MIIEYIHAALALAKYEIIDDEEPFYGEIEDLPGVWATGKTLEDCRQNLVEVLDEWIIIHLRRSLPIPRLGDHAIEDLKGLDSSARA
ncbi:MAG: type II toxin-antitoxin system HicB family antitoxin [Methanolinea sp.]|jgi:predicted RNase H-like HicB family nuclease|nr:type II toxin-antitoxin system HicB family antitoxin [Methanolinea sp.]